MIFKIQDDSLIVVLKNDLKCRREGCFVLFCSCVMQDQYHIYTAEYETI